MSARTFVQVSFILTLLTVTTVYLATMPTLITFEDAGLFHQVCYFNGIAHPPGYPLFTLICSPLYSLGFDPVITGNTLSVIFGVATLAVIYPVCRLLDLSPRFACLTLILAGASLDFWSQAIIVEVYTLNTLLFALLLWLALLYQKRPDPKFLIGLAAVAGLSLSNHWPLTAASLPGLGLLVITRHQALLSHVKQVKTIVVSILIFAAGLMPYVFLYLRPEGVFGFSGSIDGPEEFFRYVSRATYADVDQSLYADHSDQFAFVRWFMLRVFTQLSPVFGLVALLGLFLGCLTERIKHLSLLLIAAGHSLLLIFLLGFEFTYQYQTAFSHYPLVAYLCFAIWTGLGLQYLYSFVDEQTPHLTLPAVATIVAVIIWSCYTNYLINDRSDDRLAADYAKILLESLPPDAALLVDGDAQVGSVGFVSRVNEVRRDVQIYEAENVFTTERLPDDRAGKKRYLIELSQKQPVFAVDIAWLPQESVYPFFQQVGLSDAGVAVPAPKQVEFIESTASMYLNGKLHYAANLTFAHQFLIGAGRYLFKRVTSSTASPQEVRAMQLVQQTFPGALAVVSTALAEGNQQVPGESLLALLEPYNENFPLAAQPADISQFYWLLAALNTQQPEVMNRFINQAWDAMPDPRNPAYCHLNSKACPRAISN